MLKLIQRLCENHNSKLQNYLKYQDRSINNYNIIEAIVFLLQKLFIEGKFYTVQFFCIDTLTEMIQGPCESNQKEMISSKFLEFAVVVLKSDENKIVSENEENFDETIPKT